MELFDPFRAALLDLFRRSAWDQFLKSPEFVRYCQWKNIELSIGRSTRILLSIPFSDPLKGLLTRVNPLVNSDALEIAEGDKISEGS